MNFQDLGATGIIAIVILAFAVIGFLKGLIRTVLAMVCLGVAGYASLWGNEHASDLTGPWIANPGPWFPKIVAIVTGLLVFFICRYILNFLVDPFNKSKTGKRIGFGLPAAALSLCSGLAILWLAFTGIRFGGSLAELRHTQHQILKKKDGSSSATTNSPSAAASHAASIYTAPLLLKAKQSLDASSVGKWHQRTDPFYIQNKVELCQILVMYHNAHSREYMLKNLELNELLNDPAFLKLAYQENIKNAALSGNHRMLFSAKPIASALTKPEITQHLQKITPALLASMIADLAP